MSLEVYLQHLLFHPIKNAHQNMLEGSIP